MTARVQLPKKKQRNKQKRKRKYGRESEEAWYQDELIGGKPPVIK
jgi:hypothetical protein